MRAGAYRGVRDVRVEEIPEPDFGAGDVLVTRRRPLAELGRAFEEQLDKGTAVKVMVTMDG